MTMNPPPPSGRILLGLDVDGTLLDPSLLDPVGVDAPEVEAVAAAVEAGIEIVLVTGRQSHSAAAFARALGLEHGWLSCSFGAVTVRLDPGLPDGYEVTRAVTFDPRPVIAALAECPDVAIAIEEPGRGYLVDRRWPDGELVEPQIPLDGREVASTPSLMARSESMPLGDLATAADTTGLSCAAFRLRDASWINVTPTGHSKETGLEALASSLGIPRENVVAIGDDHSDVPMIRWAGWGVAMGQSPTEVKRAADEVADGVVDHGAVPIIERLIAGVGEGGQGPRG
jgi:hydroxymethylpyrimidine pyrophosphatase-like HAD family hydrolase